MLRRRIQVVIMEESSDYYTICDIFMFVSRLHLIHTARLLLECP